MLGLFFNWQLVDIELGFKINYINGQWGAAFLMKIGVICLL
jgi:hypothetical protein